MHIGIVGPCSSGPLADFLPSSGGVDLGCGGYSVVELVRALIGRGHRVSVVTLSSELLEPRILTGPSLDYYAYPTRMKRRMRDLYKAEREGLKQGISLAKPDILHAHWTYEFALACLETDFPTIVTMRDNAFQVLRFNRDLYRLGRLYLQIKVLRKARFLTAVSPYIANALSWLARDEIKVIPNLIHAPRKSQCRSEESSAVKIATVLNGWQRLKNPKAALRSFDLLRQKRPDAAMFMYGTDFDESGPAAAWARKKNVAQNIRFCGPLPREKLLQELKTASILLHPSLEESFGMAVVEAMALGIPVVAGFQSPAVRWVLDEGRAGLLTDVRNPSSMKDTLLNCIEQREDREQRRQNAYQRVAAVFSPRAVAEQYELVYDNMLRG